MHSPPFCLFIGLGVLLSACQSPTSALERRTIDFNYVEQRALELAEADYDKEAGQLPEAVQDIGYDAYRDIRFRPELALWATEDTPFRVEFFHPGRLFGRSVSINEFTETHVQEIRFSSDFYDYGGVEPPSGRLARRLGYVGFRVRYPINNADVYDEFAVFLGASYFRAVGKGQIYGVSARGLALDTGLNSPEEFPRFREFWLGKPQPGDRHLVVFALLDSPSVTGAYRFVLRPGDATTIDVEGVLFFRAKVERVGLAPMSSMFYVGANTIDKPNDFRPRIHDSDGVYLTDAAGIGLWHPATNPVRTHTRTSLFHEGPYSRYGLMQRERDFDLYQDIEAAYHLRPHAWVVPKQMPPGQPLLFEFATETETEDNVVLLYALRDPVEPLKPVRFGYQLVFDDQDPALQGRVRSTRIGRSPWIDEVYEIVIDFEGEELAGLVPETELDFPLTLSGDGSVRNYTVKKNPFNQTWRVVLYFERSGGDGPVDLRGYLSQGNQRLSETWSYRWVY